MPLEPRQASGQPSSQTAITKLRSLSDLPVYRRGRRERTRERDRNRQRAWNRCLKFRGKKTKLTVKADKCLRKQRNMLQFADFQDNNGLWPRFGLFMFDVFTFSVLNETDRLKDPSGKLRSCRNELICRHLQRDPGEEMAEGWDHRFTNDALSWRFCSDRLSLTYRGKTNQEGFDVPLRPVWIQHVLKWINEAFKLQLNWISGGLWCRNIPSSVTLNPISELMEVLYMA